MPGCTSVGTLGIMLVMPRNAIGDADPTFNASSERYPFLYETMKATRGINISKLIMGDRDRFSNRITAKSYVPRGAIGLQLGPLELVSWLPRMHGAVASGTSFPLGSTYPLFDCMFYRDNAVLYYRSCQVSGYVVTVEQSEQEDEDEIVNFHVMLVAREEDLTKSWPVTPPAITEGTGYIPYTSSQTRLQIAGTSYEVDKIRMMVDNGLRAKNRMNLTPNCVHFGRRSIRLEVKAASTSALWTAVQGLYSTLGTAQMRFLAGSLSLQYDFVAVRCPLEPWVIKTHEELPFDIPLECIRTVASPVFTCTNVSV